MVVHQDNLHCKEFKGTLDDKLTIYNRSLHATLAYTLTLK
jgi:hypothetical protein